MPRLTLLVQLPLHYINHMLTADFIDEITSDNLLPKDVLTFKDLNMKPRDTTRGVAVDHVRYMRAGGYDHGSVVDVTDPSANFVV